MYACGRAVQGIESLLYEYVVSESTPPAAIYGQGCVVLHSQSLTKNVVGTANKHCYLLEELLLRMLMKENLG